MRINKSEAEATAMRFFEQYHSLVVVKSAVLEGNVWKVVVIVGGINPETRKIMINADNGTIIGYH